VLGNVLPDLRPALRRPTATPPTSATCSTPNGRIQLTLKCTDAVIDEAIYEDVKPGDLAPVRRRRARPDYTANDDAGQLV
jgi:hypothetical protein